MASVAQDEALNARQIHQLLALLRNGMDKLEEITTTTSTDQAVDEPQVDEPQVDEPQDQPAEPPRGFHRNQPGTRFDTIINQPTPEAGPSVQRIIPPPPKRGKHAQKLRGTMEQAYRGDKELARQGYEALMKDLDEAIFIGNPFTMQHRARAYASHVETLVGHQLAKEEDCWNLEVIITHSEFTLVYRIKHSRGRGGGPIQSRTAMSYLSHHVYNICIYTRDPKTGKQAGLTAMRSGLYGRLEQRARWAVQEFQLGLHPRRQVRLDRSGVQLLIEQTLESTKHGFKRRVGIQTVTGMLMGFYGAFRVGSLTASHKEYLEKGMYLKAGDCTLLVEKPGRWKLEVDSKYWKGFSDAIGVRQIFTFDSVNQAHNVIFDLPLHLALDFTARGLFEGINDVDDLFAYDGHHLPLADEHKDKPVWLKKTNSGHDIVEGVPIRPNGMTTAISHQGVQCGIVGATVHALRRATADMYTTSLGKDKAMLVMNHGGRVGEVLDGYTTGIQHFPLVGVRLEEFVGTLTPLEREVLSNVKNASVAIDCLVRRGQMTGAPPAAQGKTWQAITPEEEALLQADGDVADATIKNQAAWSDYSSLFPGIAAPYSKECKRLVNMLQKHITPATSQQAAIKLEMFNKTNETLIRVRRKAIVRIRKQARAKEHAGGPVQAPAEVRKAARLALEKPSYLFDEATAAHQAETSKYLRSKDEVTRLTLTEAQADAMGIPESVRKTLAGLPAINNQEEATNDEVEDDEEEVEMVAEPLKGKGIPLDAVPELEAQFQPIHNSKRAGPVLEVEEEEKEPDRNIKINDEDEPNVLGLPVDVARKIYGRYVFLPIKRARQLAAAKQGKLYICSGCPNFRSRVEKKRKALEKKGEDTENIQFTMSTEGNYNKHMRVQHCAWAELELEMQQEDSDEYVCPGCQKEFETLSSCQKHCRTDCAKKDQFIPLYKQFLAFKPEDNPEVILQRQDRRRVEEWEDVDVPMTQAGLALVERLRDDLEAYPDHFEEWFGAIPKAAELGLSLTELQDKYLEIIILALQSVPEDHDEQEVFFTQGLKSSAMDDLFRDVISKLKALREDHPSDYDESSDDQESLDDE